MKLLLHCGLRRLIDNCGHNVAENAELEEEAEFSAYIFHSLSTHIEDDPQAVERITNELWQIVIEVRIDELKVGREI